MNMNLGKARSNDLGNRLKLQLGAFVNPHSSLLQLDFLKCHPCPNHKCFFIKFSGL